ncbi:MULTISPECIES: carbohydrate ABC transporter permease [Leeia]|uniref:Sugar ABC transporter permease n=1 Tax=Leeia aquatica TaxID=2725557 RepID=A0A847RYD3_9NEIS|nr:sugar ABC transporter permease [Leeia aquatica]NLR74731.1 sugar ABC transporter permease [Leeia aquatica]
MKPDRFRTLQGYLFLAPTLLLLLAFTLIPVLFNTALSFYDYFPSVRADWVGLENFKYLWEDDLFHMALKNSLTYLLIVPLIQLAAIVLAVLVNNKLPGIRLFRAAYYTPVVTMVAVIGIVWTMMYREDGLINQTLQFLHAINAPIGFLTDDSIALFAVMFVTFWRGLGYYMVIYLAGLQAIPQEMQEAATLDGANAWQRFWRITLPMLKPSILICSVLSTTAALKCVEEPWVITKGGPLNATYTGLFYVYQMGFRSSEWGRAAAAGVVLAVLCLLVAWLNFRFIRPSHR